jgi:hypothetical protein
MTCRDIDYDLDFILERRVVFALVIEAASSEAFAEEI